MALILTTSFLDHSSMATPALTKKSLAGSILGSHPRPWSLTQSHQNPLPLLPHIQSPPPASSASNAAYPMLPTSLLTVHCGRPAVIAETMAIIAISVTTPTLYAARLLIAKSSPPTTTMGLVGAAIGINTANNTSTTPPITSTVTTMPTSTMTGKLKVWTLQSSRGVMS